MADDPKTNQAKGMASPEVLAQGANSVKVDANDAMSYQDYAASRPEPVITIQHIIERRAKPPEKKRALWPNMKVNHTVMWTPIQPDPPPRPQRLAATIHTEVMYSAPQPTAPPPSIGSMEPPGRK